VTATLPESLLAEEQSRPSYMPTLEPVLQCNSELLADEDWEREALAAFADLRQYLAYWAAQGIGAKVRLDAASSIYSFFYILH
jgi:hypothetical protein